MLTSEHRVTPRFKLLSLAKMAADFELNSLRRGL
jgi:hypothetical protein